MYPKFYIGLMAHGDAAARKPIFGVFKQVWRKQGCTTTEDG